MEEEGASMDMTLLWQCAAATQSRKSDAVVVYYLKQKGVAGYLDNTINMSGSVFSLKNCAGTSCQLDLLYRETADNEILSDKTVV